MNDLQINKYENGMEHIYIYIHIPPLIHLILFENILLHNITHLISLKKSDQNNKLF
jgi:hypothetical protein